jgi:hypothetical protein
VTPQGVQRRELGAAPQKPGAGADYRNLQGRNDFIRAGVPPATPLICTLIDEQKSGSGSYRSVAPWGSRAWRLPRASTEGRFSARAHDAGDRLAIVEHDRGGDGHHLVLLSGQGVSVNVELGRGEALDVFGRNLFKHWCHGAAWATPLGPRSPPVRVWCSRGRRP